MKDLQKAIEEMETLIERLGWLFETIGGYFDMGENEKAREHFEVAYRLQGDYIKNKVNNLIKEQNELTSRRDTKEAHSNSK